jgi:hypothetical protein
MFERTDDAVPAFTMVAAAPPRRIGRGAARNCKPRCAGLSARYLQSLNLKRWDTLCTIPRDRARRLSVPLSAKLLKSLTSAIPLRDQLSDLYRWCFWFIGANNLLRVATIGAANVQRVGVADFGALRAPLQLSTRRPGRLHALRQRHATARLNLCDCVAYALGKPPYPRRGSSITLAG